MIVVDWVVFVLGLFLLVVTWVSVIGSLIVPRSFSSLLTRGTAAVTRGAFRAITRPGMPYQRRDRILAWQSPMTLFVRLLAWMLLFDVSFMLMLQVFVSGDLRRAASEAGSAIFTLGYAAPSNAGNSVLVYAAAYTGLVVIALQVGYLPTIYSAFNKREREVTLLVSRVGSPSWGPELLARTRFGMAAQDSTNELGDLYRNWELWAAEVAESHSSYLSLLWFRSPAPYSNWLISLLSVMDAAALQLSLSPDTVPGTRARLVLRMGFTCLNQIARAAGIPYVEDPDPDSPLDVTYDDFASAVAGLEKVGYPIEVTVEQAWPHFRGWRVNYEQVAYDLAYAIDAPPALWSGTRRFPSEPIPPSRPRNRTATGVTADDPQMRRFRRTVQTPRD